MQRGPMEWYCLHCERESRCRKYSEYPIYCSGKLLVNGNKKSSDAGRRYKRRQDLALALSFERESTTSPGTPDTATIYWKYMALGDVSSPKTNIYVIWFDTLGHSKCL